MGFINKFLTAIRGHATNAGNDIVDSQALVILEQEIRDIESNVGKAKGALAGVLADHKKTVHEVSSLTSDIEKYSAHAVTALEDNNEALAVEVAERIANLQSKLQQQESLRDRYAGTVSSIKKRISNSNTTVEDLKFRYKSAQARDKAQKASVQLSSANTGINSSMGGALETLERLERKQEATDLMLDASEEIESELSGSSLDKKLADAGMSSSSSSASSVLDALRAKAAKGKHKNKK